MARPNEAPNRGLLKRAREALGTVADLLAVAAVFWKWIVLAAAGVAALVAAVWKARSDSIPAWGLFAALGFVVVLALAVWVGMRWGGRRALKNAAALPAADSGHEAAAAVATKYLRAIDDSLDMLRDALADPESAKQVIGQMRNGIFSTIQLSLSTPDDQIQCAFFRRASDGTNTFLKTRHGDFAGHKKKVVKRRLYDDGRSIAGCAFAGGEPVYCSDAKSDKRFQVIDPNDPIRSVFCAPAIGAGLGEAPVGVLSISSTRVDAFSENDKTFVTICASALAGGELLEQRISATASYASASGPIQLPTRATPPGEERNESVVPSEAEGSS